MLSDQIERRSASHPGRCAMCGHRYRIGEKVARLFTRLTGGREIHHCAWHSPQCPEWAFLLRRVR
jgi:hypothetical protein